MTKILRILPALVAGSTLFAFASPAFGAVRITEFLADNASGTLADEDDDTPDWVELFNPDAAAADLGGLYLTDDFDSPTKWQFPDVSIPAGGYLVVFASSKDRIPTDGSNLHTNFSLSADGESLALIAADGETVISAFGTPEEDFPRQREGISYGVFGDPLEEGYMLVPTPGAANDAESAVFGFVSDTDFSVSRGFFDAPFALSINTETEGATIHYTTDGSWPSEIDGTVFDPGSPIMVDRVMVVKAIAFKEGCVSTNIDTHTYILPDSVLAQTADITESEYGLPSRWSSQIANYGIDNNPSVNPQEHPTIREDLKTVPSLSIGIEADDMFGRRGIYSNPESSGISWERLTSLEFIDPSDPSGDGNFQENCAIRIQGGAFRSFNLTKKKSFRVLFKSSYGTNDLPTGGPGSLEFPLFGDGAGATTEFQTLVFRMESNDGWQWNGATTQPQYARDQFGRDSHRALGHPAARGRFLNLYINGVYWGVYNVVERPDASFADTYIEGAERDLWEGQNSGTPINDAESIDTWNDYLEVVAPISTLTTDAERDAKYLEACGFNTDGTRNPSLPIWCDPNNTIDYFLVNWYSGNSDWPRKNYYGGIDTRVATRTGYKYFMWDSEWSLFLRSTTSTNNINDFRGIAEPNQALHESREYQMRFADRAHRALFNDGALTPENAQARYESITEQHTSILVPEAARWGNQHSRQIDIEDWQAEYDTILRRWFPRRGTTFIRDLQRAGLYPNLDAPVYSFHGGPVTDGIGPTISIESDDETIYYMLGAADADYTDYGHSLDPRLPGGAPNPAATIAVTTSGQSLPIQISDTSWLFSRTYDGATGEWSALNTALFTTSGSEPNSENLIVSELNYHPAEPSASGETAVSTDRDDFEFIELMNVGTTTLDLGGLSIAGGISFVFPEGTLLAPGAQIVVPKNRTAFQARYASRGIPIVLAKDAFGSNGYSGRLGNSGDEITLVTAAGDTILSFAYTDDSPWPTSAGGFGSSLVLSNPSSPIPDLSDPANWEASVELGGSPGGLEIPFRLEDVIGAYSAGTETFTVGGATESYATITFIHKLPDENTIVVSPEVSSGLTSWVGEGTFVLVSEIENGDGTETIQYRRTSPLSADTGKKEFIRLSITSTP